jgi:hypothetical protein
MRTPPTVSLLTSAEEVPNTPSENDPEGVHWLNGITYRREHCGVGDAGYVYCDPDDAYSKDLDDDPEIITTDPFLVWNGDSCSSFGFPSNDYVGRAMRALAATEAYQVEKEYWSGLAAQAGTGYDDSQWLTTNNAPGQATDVTGGTAVPPVRALGLLHEALGDCNGGGRGMVHMAAEVLPHFWQFDLFRRDGARFFDMRDHIIVPGYGYDDTGIDDAAPGVDEAWIFATGMVRYWRTPVDLIPGSFTEAFDRVNNLVTYRAERYYLVDDDRCCRFAALVDLTV